MSETLRDGTKNEFTYDGFGNRTSVKTTKNGQTSETKASYNVYNQLTSMGNESFTYDKNGNRLATYEYDAWGNPLKADETAAVKDNTYRYAGYQYDHETGMYYLMARYYEPKHGVFLSLDPDPGDEDDIITQNGYTYANNNPVMLVDPDGHIAWLAVNAGWAAIDGYRAYKAGKGWKGVAGAAAWGFIGGSKFKAAKKLYSSAKIATQRRSAVRNAWKQERDMIIRTGKGTRNWSNKRKAEIVNKGKAKGMIGHHINNVRHHRDMAGNPNNIRFVSRKKHYRLHNNGRWWKKTTGKLIRRR